MDAGYVGNVDVGVIFSVKVNVEASKLWVIFFNLAPVNAGDDACCWVSYLKFWTPYWEDGCVDMFQPSIKGFGSILTSSQGLKHFVLKLG